MFTGIITAIGCVASVADKGDRILRISCDWDCEAIDLGASISCSGICLTVIKRQKQWFEVAASAETLAVTTIGSWQAGDKINLERALRFGDELGGHIVSGHVDGLAVITDISPRVDSHEVWLEVPAALSRFIAPKGSVTLDGVSLTVNTVDGNRFSVNIIEHTWSVTCWGAMVAGMTMNVEIDILARYVARLVNTHKDWNNG